MKKLFLFTLTVFLLSIVFVLIGCKQVTEVVPEVIEDPPIIAHDDPPPEEPPVVVDNIENVVLALYDGATLRLWDGTSLTDAYVGHVVPAGNKKLAFEDVLYYFDDTGNSVHSKWLPVVPDKVIAVKQSSLRAETSTLSRSAVAYEDSVITLEDIPPEEAYPLGARYEHYTRIFENGEEIGLWYLNEWECTDVIQTASGHILAIDELGNYRNLTDDKNIETAYDGGIMTYNMGTQEGYISDESGEYAVTWSMNYFDNSRWQLAGGVWYTENGYTWTPETGVLSNVNKMYGWNSFATCHEDYDGIFPSMPYMLPAGVYYENGEECTYWIECNTGQLYRHIPSVDRLDMIIELYDGDGTREGGIPYFNTLDPQVIDGKMYYHEGGAIKTYDFTTGLVSVFSTDQEVIEW